MCVSKKQNYNIYSKYLVNATVHAKLNVYENENIDQLFRLLVDNKLTMKLSGDF